MNATADHSKLRQLRQGHELTRAQAALRARISVHTLKDLERGRRQPSITTLWRLADVYECQATDLVTVEK